MLDPLRSVLAVTEAGLDSAEDLPAAVCREQIADGDAGFLRPTYGERRQRA